MNYTSEQIDRARQWDIVEVAGRLNLPLKRRGATQMMRCLAHEERTPSMQVGGRRNIAKCYACGKVYDTLSLVIACTNCTFPEAVKFITGEDPPTYNGGARQGSATQRQSKLYLKPSPQRPQWDRPREAGTVSGSNVMGFQPENAMDFRPEDVNVMGFHPENVNVMGFHPEDVNAMVSLQNPLSQCLLQRLAREDVERVTYLYRLGLWYDRDHYPRTAFPLIDRLGRVHDVKVQRYETRPDHERFAHSLGTTFWLGSLMLKSREPIFTHDVLFGEHLLDWHPERMVGLVESPKNAVVAACAFPGITWVATGNKGMLKRQVLAPLANRDVLVFPDKDAMAEWSDKLRTMQDLAHFVVSDQGQTEDAKSDIADAILKPPAVTCR